MKVMKHIPTRRCRQSILPRKQRPDNVSTFKMLSNACGTFPKTLTIENGENFYAIFFLLQGIKFRFACIDWNSKKLLLIEYSHLP